MATAINLSTHPFLHFFVRVSQPIQDGTYVNHKMTLANGLPYPKSLWPYNWLLERVSPRSTVDVMMAVAPFITAGPKVGNPFSRPESFIATFLTFFFFFWPLWVSGAAPRLSLVVASGGYSSLQCTGFSLWWLLLLQRMGSRCAGFSSCGLWAQ